MQLENDENSKTYMDFENIESALEGTPFSPLPCPPFDPGQFSFVTIVRRNPYEGEERAGGVRHRLLRSH